ncbi:AAA family ATPase [Dickeya dadantii]|uniref:ATP-binding protein n=2 Tax=Dickeya dadantii TaxID=204038 RepID=UPI001495A9DE|nr:ATP-binding protein [Dickeya dadantii]NPE55822.1 AAA family ATPase [Dickeya dadantii]NPE68335.1 AAA family ATPase [Dickeya dadantii]
MKNLIVNLWKGYKPSDLIGVNMIVMVAGVYGVGKSTVSNKLSEDFNIKFHSASDLIKAEKGYSTWDKDKKTDQVKNNQEYLIKAINKMSGDDFLLDGHFCLINKNGNIENIDFSTIKKLHINAVLLLKENPGIISRRLFDRDKVLWDESFISKMQESEESQAKLFTHENNIPFSSMYVNNYNAIKKFITKSFYIRKENE